MTSTQTVRTHIHPGVVLGFLGSLTGAASALQPNSVIAVLKPLSQALGIDGGGGIGPALVFGPVVAYSIWAYGGLSGTRRWWAGLLAFVATLVAWIAAVRTGDFVFSSTDQFTEGVKWLVAGALAGAVGASITFAGAAAAVPSLRRFKFLGTAILIGTIAGLLLWLADQSELEPYGLIIFFAVWQSAIAAWLGVCLNIGATVRN